MKLLLLSSLLFCTAACGQLVQTASPAITRTSVYDKRFHNALQFAANQAALGNVNGFATALYGEKRFLLRELSVYHLSIAQPAGPGAFGLYLFYSGDADYNTSKTGFAYGRNLSERLAAGVQFNYWTQHIRSYGTTAQVTVEGALLVHLSEVLHVGIQVSNPVGVVLNKAAEKLPGIYTIGAGYQPSPNVAITTEFIKIKKMPVAVQAAVEYHFTASIWCKAGLNSNTTAFFIAAGFQLKDFSIEVAGAVHPQLGLSPGLLLAYNTMDK